MDVYCISLEKYKDNWPRILGRLKEVGFTNAQIFPAVIGSNFKNLNSPEVLKYGPPENFISIWTLYTLKNNISRKCHEQIPRWGGIGCTLSHITLWKTLLNSKNDRMLIFEDDIGKFSKNFQQKFQKFTDNLPSDTDVAFLDIYKNTKGKAVNDYVKSIKSQFFGMHAYIITKKAAQNFLKKIFPIETQIDSYIFQYAELFNMKLYVSSKYMCTQANEKSSSIQDKCFICMFTNKTLILFISIILLLFIFLILYKRRCNT